MNTVLLKLGNRASTIQWYPLGLALGVPKQFLEELIQRQYTQNEYLVEVLDYWLRNHHGLPTFEEVLDAEKGTHESKPHEYELPSRVHR